MSVFNLVTGQAAAVAEIKRAATAARALVQSTAVAKSAENAAQIGMKAEQSSITAEQNDIKDAAMSHAWLFTGPPGSGRSILAQVFAAALLCQETELGGGNCAECKAVLGRNHPDVEFLRTDLVTISVEEVRACVAKSYLAPTAGFWRIFIVEDADRMLPRTTNVLLKAIEEPAPRTVWILCTASPADVLPTIRSRCRNINLVTPTIEEVANLLVEEGVEKEKALVAAQIAQSHIGLARALALDPEAGKLRKQTLDLLLSVHSVGDAVLAAELLTNIEKMQGRNARSSAAEKHSVAGGTLEKEKRRRLEAWGLDENMKIPASLRSHISAQINNAEEDEKRRRTRMQRDALDRELLYMAGFFRDVLLRQLGATLPLANPDYEDEVYNWADSCSVESILEKIAAIREARTRLTANVAPLLVIEAVLMEVIKK